MMNSTDNTFRVHVRLNKVEFADLKADIEQYEGPARAGRIRLLLRCGLAALKGQAIPAERNGLALHPVEIPAMPVPAIKPAVIQNEAKVADADALLSMGMDPANFHFGQS